MYILVNRKPVDVFKIEIISEVIPLTRKKYRAAINYLEESTFEALRKRKIESEHKKSIEIVMKIIKYVVNDIIGGNCETMTGHIPIEIEPLDDKKVYGYYFCIVPGKDEDWICSKIYKTQEEAEKSLKDFLELVNTVRCIVSEINI
jgi:hypothetical protein